MRKVILNILPIFLPIALAVTLLCGLLYITLQQNYRISANDPQIQIAEDISSQLEKGTPPQYFIPNIKIDISKSLGTFISIYDEKGNEIGSSALIGNTIPKLPQDIFSKARNNKELRFTWAPQKNVRVALVLVHYKNAKGGFVAIGRSLTEVEKRIHNLELMIFFGWAITIASVFTLQIVQKKLS